MQWTFTKEASCSGGPGPGWALEGGCHVPWPFCQQHFTPSVLCAPGQTQASRGFVRRTNVFSPVPYIRDSSQGLSEKATHLATPPVQHCFLRTDDGQVLAHETGAPSLQGPYPILPNFVALGSPEPAPKHGWPSPRWLAPYSGARSCFLQQIILFEATLGKSTVLLGQQIGGKEKKKPHAKLESSFVSTLPQ